MTKFKAAILVKQKKPLVVDEIQLPKLGYGQVLVKVCRSTICGAQINEIDGTKGKDNFLPHLLGHEGGGIVLETGNGVNNLKKDDRVVMHWRKGIGINSKTPKYKWRNKTVNGGWVTTFNELSVVSENRLTKIDKKTDFDTATLMGCSVTTAFGLLNNEAEQKIGESLISAYPIVAVDVNEKKINFAKKFGATHTINARKENIEKAIRKIVGVTGPDVIVENTGNNKIIEMAYKIVKSRTGRVILVGVPNSKKNISIHSLPLHFGKILKGTEGGGTNPSIDIPNYFKLLNNKKIKIKKLITNHYKLENINEAIKDVRNGVEIKCCIDL